MPNVDNIDIWEEISIFKYLMFWETVYFFEGTPVYIFARPCAAGAEILNAAECRAACDQLKLDINPKLMKDGRPCYKNGKG